MVMKMNYDNLLSFKFKKKIKIASSTLSKCYIRQIDHQRSSYGSLFSVLIIVYANNGPNPIECD